VPSTYNKIAAHTIASAVASYTFTSIPGTYTDLVIIVDATATTGADDLLLQFNSDTATNYSETILTATGSAVTSVRFSTQTAILLDYNGVLNTTKNNRIIQVMNYANTTTFKTVLIRANNAATGVDAIVGLWRKTPEAITSITIKNTGTSSNFAIGSTLTLYGIKAA
jgi:hypothetical protein